MPRPEQRNPAAPELLGSMGAGGAEHFSVQADNDKQDTLPTGFDQSFPTRWIARGFGLSLDRVGLVVALASLSGVHDGKVSAAGRQVPTLVKCLGILKTTAIEKAVRCSAALESNVVRAHAADRFAPLLCPVLGGRDG